MQNKIYSEQKARYPNTFYYDHQSISSSSSRKYDNNIIKLTKTKQVISQNQSIPHTSPKQYKNSYKKDNENIIPQIPYNNDNTTQRNGVYKYNNQSQRHIIYYSNNNNYRTTERDYEKHKMHFFNENINTSKNENINIKFHKSPTNSAFTEIRNNNIKNDNSDKSSNISQINTSHRNIKNYNSSNIIQYKKKPKRNFYGEDIIPNLREKLYSNRGTYTNAAERYNDESDNQSEEDFNSEKFNSNKSFKDPKKSRVNHLAICYESKKNDEKNNIEEDIKNENNIKDNNIIITNNNICYITPIQFQQKKLNNKISKNLKEITIKKNKDYSQNKNKNFIIKNNYKNNIYYSFYKNSKSINSDNPNNIPINKDFILNNSTSNSNKKLISIRQSSKIYNSNSSNRIIKNSSDNRQKKILLPKNKIIKIQNFYRNYLNKKKFIKNSKFYKHLLKFMSINKKKLENIFMNLLHKNTDKKIIVSLINRNNKLILKADEINLLHKEIGDSFNITGNNLHIDDIIKENTELKNQLFDNKNIEQRLNQLLIENKKNQNINAIIMKDNQLLAKKLKNIEAKKNTELAIQNQPSFDLTQQNKKRNSLSLINIEYLNKLKILYIKCIILKVITKHENILKKKFTQYKNIVLNQGNINNNINNNYNELEIISKHISIYYLAKKSNCKKFAISKLINEKETLNKKILYKYFYKFYYISKFSKTQEDVNLNFNNKSKKFKTTEIQLVIIDDNKKTNNEKSTINDSKKELIKKLLTSIFHKYERNIYLLFKNCLFEWKLRSIIFKMKTIAREIKRKKKLKKKNRDKLAKETLNKLKQKSEMLQSAHEFSYKIDKIENKNNIKQEDNNSKIGSTKEEKRNSNESDKDSGSSIGEEL